MSATGKTNGVGPMLTTAEAAKKLGITPRHFQRLRSKLGGIDGATLVDGAWAFPQASIDSLADRDTELESEEPETIEEGAAALTREVVKAHKDVMNIAIDLLRLSLAEGKSKDERLADSQKAHLENMKMLKEFIVGAGELEVQRMKAEGDQTVRIERTRVAAKGMKMLTPVLKRGMAWALKSPELARDAQSEGLLELFRNITDEKRQRLLGLMTDKQREAFESLATYAAAHETLDDQLKTFKDEMTEEQGLALMQVLDQKEIQAIMSLFEDDEEKGPGLAKTKLNEEKDEKKSA